MTSKKLKALLPLIPSDDLALTDLINRTCIAQLTKEEAITKRDDLLREAAAGIEANYKYDALINECETTLKANKEILEAWSLQNAKRFGDKKSLQHAGSTFGWRSNGWNTILSSASATWALVVEKLKALVSAAKHEKNSSKPHAEVIAAGEIAATFLRVKVEPAKDVMLLKREDAAALAVLTTCDVGFEEKETFYFRPDRIGQEGPEI